jgi:hypothetical protein
MDRCPLCRAALHGAETCRRCRAELQSAQRAEREGQALVGAAMLSLCRGRADIAEQLLRRASMLHATPETLALQQIVAALLQRAADAEAGRMSVGDAAL